MNSIKEIFNKNKNIIAVVIDDIFYIKNATTIGYLIAEPYDGVDLSYISQNKRRGRVQKHKSQTITCVNNLGVLVYE